MLTPRKSDRAGIEDRRPFEEDDADALLRLLAEPTGDEDQLSQQMAEEGAQDEADLWSTNVPEDAIVTGDYAEPGQHTAGDKAAYVSEGPDRGVWAEWDPDDFAPATVLEDGSARPLEDDSPAMWYRASEDPTAGEQDPRQGKPGFFDSILDLLLGKSNTIYVDPERIG